MQILEKDKHLKIPAKVKYSCSSEVEMKCKEGHKETIVLIFKIISGGQLC
jgi:hypothetical protein